MQACEAQCSPAAVIIQQLQFLLLLSIALP
jgi:hypothetical protein